MRTHILGFIMLILSLAFSLPSATAQYYGYYPYPHPPSMPYYSRYQVPYEGGPFFYRLAPNPRLYWKWNQQNRMSDYDQLLPNPLNPESALDYMLRTF